MYIDRHNSNSNIKNTLIEKECQYEQKILTLISFNNSVIFKSLFSRIFSAEFVTMLLLLVLL